VEQGLDAWLAGGAERRARATSLRDPETTPVRTQPFGSTDLQVSELGLGCARLGGIFQTGGAGFVDLLSAARDGGITFFDRSGEAVRSSSRPRARAPA
jgi:hypothetical protein